MNTSADARIRVAAVPAAHAYVRAVTDPVEVDVFRDPVHEGAPLEQWWPPRFLEPDYLATRIAEIDVLHVHFGMESHAPRAVVEAFALARAAGVPVVLTVHDLENPQLVDQTPHRAMLDAVVPAADIVLTLTETAAAEIRTRYGRRAMVVPHPRLHHVPLDLPAPAGARRVGLHLGDLRPNIAAVRGVETLLGALDALNGDAAGSVIAEVHLRDRVRDERAAEQIAALVSGRRDATLMRHGRLDDESLVRQVASLDALVLPYAWGTHSGWVELCHDAAVPVAGTPVGAVAAQHPADFHPFRLDDPASLAAALAAAFAAPETRREARATTRASRRAERDREADAVRRTHTGLYAELIAPRAAA